MLTHKLKRENRIFFKVGSARIVSFFFVSLENEMKPCIGARPQNRNEGSIGISTVWFCFVFFFKQKLWTLIWIVPFHQLIIPFPSYFRGNGIVVRVLREEIFGFFSSFDFNFFLPDFFFSALRGRKPESPFRSRLCASWKPFFFLSLFFIFWFSSSIAKRWRSPKHRTVASGVTIPSFYFLLTS